MPTPAKIDLIIEDDRWNAALPDAAALIQSAVEAAFSGANFDEIVSVSVLLADDARIKTLNSTFRGRDKPTNVLSFPAQETPAFPGEPKVLGDIALAFETMQSEADVGNRPLRNHFLHLIVHASLHLIGYTHESDEEAEHMEALEIAILAGLDVPNPYDDAGDRQPAYGTREP